LRCYCCWWLSFWGGTGALERALLSRLWPRAALSTVMLDRLWRAHVPHSKMPPVATCFFCGRGLFGVGTCVTLTHLYVHPNDADCGGAAFLAELVLFLCDACMFDADCGAASLAQHFLSLCVTCNAFSEQ